MTWLENATSISTLGHRSPSDGHDARDAVRLKNFYFKYYLERKLVFLNLNFINAVIKFRNFVF